MTAKVIVGLSGGVDSSVAAWLLKEQGYQVEGLFMKNWEQDDTDTYCAAAEDLADATSVAKQLDIPIHTVNFASVYWDKVFEHFLDEYNNGRTPNPDVLCNKEIKFKAFLEHALTLGADFIATGHYAKIVNDNGQFALHKAKDRTKDQSYFLHAIHPDVLKKTLFPVGDYLKTDIREMAKQLQLATSHKKDSTGICFIGERRFKTFLNEYLLCKPGEIRSATDQLLGQHDGLMFYTLGQRQGLQIGGLKDSGDEPWYVVDKLLDSNTLIVAQGAHHPRLYSQGLMCKNIHWLSAEPPAYPLTCHAKSRYRQPDFACVVSEAQSNGQHCVLFSEPQRAVTPGQYLVLYDKNRCLGGAVIESLIH